MTLNVTAVNDAPVNTVGGAQTVTEDTALTFTGGDLVSVNDVDGNVATTQLTVANGTLTVSLAGGRRSARRQRHGDLEAGGHAGADQRDAGDAVLHGERELQRVGHADGALERQCGGADVGRGHGGDHGDGGGDIVADTLTTNEDTAITANVITGSGGASADNVESGDRTLTTVTQGSNGTVTFTAAGAVTYTPNANFNGADSFTYTVTSGGVTETATVTVNVTAVNDAPVNTVGGARTVAEDTVLTFTGRDLVSVNDVDGNVATAQLAVGNGTLTVSLAGGATISAARTAR